MRYPKVMLKKYSDNKIIENTAKKKKKKECTPLEVWLKW
jgi:hypothetical protein